MNPETQLNLCWSCGFLSNIANSVETKILHKTTQPQELPYIMLLCKMHALYYTNIENMWQKNQLNHSTKCMKIDVLESKDILRFDPSLSAIW